MSRMVQCPKCRAILQEPPPGNPYYKCGSCYTVLQAKHSLGGDGPQRPTGEDIVPAQKQMPSRSVRPLAQEDSEDPSEYQRQKTLPSRLRRPLDEVEEEKRQERAKTRSARSGILKPSQSLNETTTASRTRSGTLQPVQPQAQPLIQSTFLQSVKSNHETLLSRPSRGRNRVTASGPLPEREMGEGPLNSQMTGSDRAKARREALKSRLKNAPPQEKVQGGQTYARMKTLPSKLEEGEREGETRQETGLKGGGEAKEEGLEGDSGENFRRTKTMPGKVGGGVPLPPAPVGGGILKKTSTIEQRAVRNVDHQEDHDSYIFRRQKTLPSLMPAATEEEEEDDNEDLRGRNGGKHGGNKGGTSGDLPLPPGYARQKTLPAKLPVDDEEEEEEKSDGVQIPARLRVLLDRGIGGSRAPGNPRAAPLKGGLGGNLGGPSNKQPYQFLGGRGKAGGGLGGERGERVGGLGAGGLLEPSPQIPARLQLLLEKKGPTGAASSSSSRNSFEKVTRQKSEGVEARQAMREALLSGGRSQVGALKGSGTGSGIGGNLGGNLGLGQKHHRRLSDPVEDPRAGGRGANGGGIVGGDHRRIFSADTHNEGPIPRRDSSQGLGEGENQVGSQEPSQEVPMLPPPDAPQVVECQHCSQMLAVPPTLPPSKKGLQKLRCGKCLLVSAFALRPPPDQTLPPVTRGLAQAPAPAPGPRQPSAVKKLPEVPQERTQSVENRGGILVTRRPIPPEEEGSGPLGGSGGGSSGGSGGVLGGGIGPGLGGSRRGRRISGGRPVAEDYERKVKINGQNIPDRLVEKAEEKAGPIYPGDYWYDFRAGFWGVRGGPCMGIIPPGIQEFNIPLAPDCSSGRTRVFVNGRELHKKDLELLKKRGLPDTPNKGYLIDVFGNVVDEPTRQELRGLGRLAPSLDERKRGGGMYVA